MKTNMVETMDRPEDFRGLDCAPVVAAIRSVLPAKPVVLHEPWFAGKEREYVLECIETGWVSSAGKFVDRFEQMLAEYTGVGSAVGS